MTISIAKAVHGGICLGFLCTQRAVIEADGAIGGIKGLGRVGMTDKEVAYAQRARSGIDLSCKLTVDVARNRACSRVLDDGKVQKFKLKEISSKILGGFDGL